MKTPQSTKNLSQVKKLSSFSTYYDEVILEKARSVEALSEHNSENEQEDKQTFLSYVLNGKRMNLNYEKCHKALDKIFGRKTKKLLNSATDNRRSSIFEAIEQIQLKQATNNRKSGHFLQINKKHKNSDKKHSGLNLDILNLKVEEELSDSQSSTY